MSPLNTIVTYRELRKVFNRQDLAEFHDAAAEAGPTRASRMVHAFSSSLGSFFNKYEREETSDGPVLESADDQPTSLLQGYLAERAEEIGAIEPLASGGFEAKLDSFQTKIEDKHGWVKELGHVFDRFRKERVPYHETDTLGWLGSFFGYWKGIRRHPWLEATTPEVVSNEFRLAMIGDWATGMYGAPDSARSIQSNSKGYNAVLHLGDIYYAGSNKDVKNRFLPFWPKPAGAVLRALNANHEMYTGGHGYFNFVLPPFKQSASYFALVNNHWLLVGLDTAYAGKFNIFSDGKLTDDQVVWLRHLAELHKDKNLILFTHHYPFSLIDWQGPRKRLRPQTSQLFLQLHELFRDNRVFAWYWGHEHRCLLYERDERGGYYGRCVGHGGFPYSRDRTPYVTGSPATSRAGIKWRLLPGKNLMPNALFLDGPNPYVPGREEAFGSQGYMTIELSGPQLNEVVHLPDGTIIHEKRLI